MTRKKKEKKKQSGKWLLTILPGVVGGVMGISIAHYSNELLKSGKVTEEYGSGLGLVVWFIGLLAIVLQIIIHEAGHLIFGLLTGYQYSSFRIGSFMWQKKDGKIHFRRMSLAGTAGQCIMVPPDMVDGKMPYVLYNLGGSICNMVVAIICLILRYTGVVHHNYLNLGLFMMAAIGFIFALGNGIPFKTQTINNDGYNAISLGKDPEALRSFWIQMKTNEAQVNGMRIKDMPKEWFKVPSPEGMKNSMVAALGVYACNRLMDEGELEKADQLMEELMAMDSAMVGIHRNLLVCDRIYCELMHANRQEVLSEMLTNEQKQFMKSMKKFPSVLRTEYAYALMAEKNVAKANQIKEQFEKIARTFPYPGDIEGERELMDRVCKMAA